jgi:uncharacterized protein (UPF0210 family)
VDVRLDCMGSLACLEMVVNPVSSLEQWEASWRPGGRSAGAVVEAMVDVRLDCMGSLACLEMVVNPVSSLEQWWRPGGRSA